MTAATTQNNHRSVHSFSSLCVATTVHYSWKGTWNGVCLRSSSRGRVFVPESRAVAGRNLRERLTHPRRCYHFDRERGAIGIMATISRPNRYNVAAESYDSALLPFGSIATRRRQPLILLFLPCSLSCFSSGFPTQHGHRFHPDSKRFSVLPF
jgi:hypothetical protein